MPTPRSIQYWYSTLDTMPGISLDALKLLREKRDKLAAEGRELIVSLSLDEMSIRKGYSWDGKKSIGQVDLGDGILDAEGPLAREALVFLVTSIDLSFKVPIAFYFVAGLKADRKAELVTRY